MATKPKWAELSDIQRRSWIHVGPFIVVHLTTNLLLLIAYALGLTDTVLGNGGCLAIEALNTGVTDLHRSIGSPVSLDRICQLYVPAALTNIVFAGVLGALIINAQGVRVIISKYFMPLLVFAIVPLILLALNQSKSMTSSLAVSLRSGSWTAYVVFLIGTPLITGMLALLPLQKYEEGRTHEHNT